MSDVNWDAEEDADDFGDFNVAEEFDEIEDEETDAASAAKKRKRTARPEKADPDACVDRTDREEDAILRGLPSFMHDLSDSIQREDEQGRETFVHNSASTGASADGDPLYEITGTTAEWARDFVAYEDAEIARMQAEWAQPDDSAYTAEAYSLDMSGGMPLILISNLITVAELRERISSERVSSNGVEFGFRFNQKKFAAVVACKKNPKVTVTIFPPGLLISLGSRELSDAMVATQLTVDQIRSIKVWTTRPRFLYPDLSVKAIKLRNVVATSFLFFGIDFELLLKNNFVRFEDRFIGCIMYVSQMHPRYAKRRIKVLVFEGGAIVITGPKTRFEVLDVYSIVFPHLARCATFGGQSNWAKKNNFKYAGRKSNMQARIEADQRRARALPPTSKEIIHLNTSHLVRMYVEANNLRPSTASYADNGRLVPFGVKSNALVLNSVDASKRDIEIGTRFKRRANDETMLARNVIALQSMGQYERAQAERLEFERNRRDAARTKLTGALQREPTSRELDKEINRQSAPKRTNVLSFEESLALAEDVIGN